MHVNHRYMVRWGLSAQQPILDYGCGKGEVVAELRRRGVEALGAETWYGGRTASDVRLVEEEMQEYVRPIVAGHLPFPDGSFGMVMHNQVIEHVHDLTLALEEMHRVLRPGGVMLSIFPQQSCWREGHTGIPFLHWFPQGGVRSRYVEAMRALGFGFDFWGNTPRTFRERTLRFLDEDCVYRKYPALRAAYAPYFTWRHIEADYAKFRAEWRWNIPNWIIRIPYSRLAGLVILSERRG